MFYIGYLVFQFPFGYLLQHFPTGRLLALTIIAWGAVLITTPACTSFAGIATNRFFLGALESATNPGEPILVPKESNFLYGMRETGVRFTSLCASSQDSP